METFDVIIIGAGPAGLKCAETLGNSKFRVLVLEKNKEIWPKVCAGWLTAKGIAYLGLPQELIDFSYNKLTLHVNKSSSSFAHTSDFVYTVDRKAIGQRQLQKLQKYKNIEVRTDAMVSAVTKTHVIIDGKNIAYTYLIGADWSNSIVKRYLNLPTKNLGIAIQYIIPTKKYTNIEVFFESKLFSTRYAWIFPHKEYVSIGCWCDPKHISTKTLKANFELWLKRNNIDVSQGEYQAFALNYNYQGHQFGNVFLAGDAAGFISWLTGEGIYTALISGEEIGKVIRNPKYSCPKIAEILKMKKRHNKLTNFLIACGKLKTIVFYIGMILSKLHYFRKKAIDWLT